MDAARAASNAGSKSATIYQQTVFVFADQACDSRFMPPVTTQAILQLIVGLGLLNVWILRAGRATAYRGGPATNLKEEFAAYGLSDQIFYLVGFLKVSSGLALLAGLWLAEVVVPAASTVSVLMLGALMMHAKVKDPMLKSLPAFLMLLASATIAYLALR